jgi:hypothetical protein
MEFGGRFGGIWQGARKGLEADIYRSWQASLGDRSPGPVLAWEFTDRGQYCVLSNGLLSISSGDLSTPDWRHIGWHEIERGGFDGERLTLRWRRYDSDEETLALHKPGRVAQVFRERVAASIAVEQFIPLGTLGPERGVIISGRRNLSEPDAPIQWRASLTKGASWQTPGIRELADASIQRLRAEYDPRP